MHHSLQLLALSTTHPPYHCRKSGQRYPVHTDHNLISISLLLPSHPLLGSSHLSDEQRPVRQAYHSWKLKYGNIQKSLKEDLNLNASSILPTLQDILDNTKTLSPQARADMACLLAHAHELKVAPFTTTINTAAWKLLRDYKGDDSSASPQLPSQMRTNMSAAKRMWKEGDIQRAPHIGTKSWHQHRYHLDLDLRSLPLSPWDESKEDRVTQTLNSPHPSDSQIPDPELNKTPTREDVKEMLKNLPSDKAAGPDGITNRILQASGEQAIDMIYLYMLIIWEVETYPGAWASALMQPIYKGGGKDRHSPVSYRGIYLLNTLTKLFEGLTEARLSKFTELKDTLTPSQQGSRITRQTHDAIYALIATIQERSQYGFASYCCFIDLATAYPSVLQRTLGSDTQKL